MFQDVRPSEEYDVSHIPSAIRLDPDTQDIDYIKKVIQDSANSNSSMFICLLVGVLGCLFVCC